MVARDIIARISADFDLLLSMNAAEAELMWQCSLVVSARLESLASVLSYTRNLILFAVSPALSLEQIANRAGQSTLENHVTP
jgi:hypothetical protein